LILDYSPSYDRIRGVKKMDKDTAEMTGVKHPGTGEIVKRTNIFNLDGNVAVVTGSAQGLGYTMAQYLAEFGAHVVIADLNEVGAKETAEHISKTGAKALGIGMDVMSLDEIDEMVKRVMDEFGRIDILVNSAGINIREMALDVTEEHWDKILDINLKGLFFTTQAVARVMKERRYGKVINISSHMARIALPLRAAYCSSKGGVAQLTKELAIEWAPFNITVNAIAPSFFVTPMNEPLFSDPKMSRFIRENTPIGRPGDPEELGGAVVFLASPASSFITGHLLFVDGGYTCR
jgi:NAD(P)-dependent dehydrogenase (short-subunit alcohol dehydrogenase family)